MHRVVGIAIYSHSTAHPTRVLTSHQSVRPLLKLLDSNGIKNIAPKACKKPRAPVHYIERVCVFRLGAAHAMGTSLSRSFSRYWNRNERRLLLVGLDGAGKTTILYHLRLGKAIASIPTVGFNVETIKYDGYKLNVWVSWFEGGTRQKHSSCSLVTLQLFNQLGRRGTGHSTAILEASLHRDAGTDKQTERTSCETWMLLEIT